ncbi:hypothetical protein [Desulfovibrio litoralis]|uniref:Autotransporter beta-domain-containing protein n=1 Tax=Desulfovibrio litoralis DSM 11393 TaxID=1121455 RepID=A0A1M7TLC0_9BACT|nr:hypothetical protein [Desulfovibrio litoralis]SHN71510.1 hypothetical protein SAMN02745728_02200 [Desulfovibrio litoralis DSM 11393]
MFKLLRLLSLIILCCFSSVSYVRAGSGNSIVNGRVANIASVNQGGDLISKIGLLKNIFSVVTMGNGYRTTFFGLMSGGNSNYGAESHIDLDALAILTGLTEGIATPVGVVELSAFFEKGQGSYSHSEGALALTESGDTNYHGGGIMGRYYPKCIIPLYIESSFRKGQSETKFSGKYANGERAFSSFEVETPYHGVHGQLGLLFGSNKMTIDVSTAYIWTHFDDSTAVSSNEKILFAPIDSHRWRSGVKGTFNGSPFDTYAGAYFEHEFNGKSRVNMNGQKFNGTSLIGSTAIGEFGVIFLVARPMSLSVDAGVKGYTGMREGVEGSLQINFSF